MTINPQYVVLFHHFRIFLKKAAERGIDAAPLKGAHLLTSVYPEGADRGPMADVDFLVRPEDVATAATILEEMGFVRQHSELHAFVDHEQSFHLPIGRGHHIMFELHSGLFGHRRLPIDYDGIWTRSSASQFDGVFCRRLSSADTFVHVAVHSGIHRWMGIERDVRDLMMLAQNGEVAWDSVVRVAKEWRVSRFVWLAMRMVMGTAPNIDLTPWMKQLAPPLSVRKMLTLILPDHRTSRISEHHHRVQAALLWPWLFDSPLVLARFMAGHSAVGRMMARLNVFNETR